MLNSGRFECPILDCLEFGGKLFYCSKAFEAVFFVDFYDTAKFAKKCFLIGEVCVGNHEQWSPRAKDTGRLLDEFLT